MPSRTRSTTIADRRRPATGRVGNARRRRRRSACPDVNLAVIADTDTSLKVRSDAKYAGRHCRTKLDYVNPWGAYCGSRSPCETRASPRPSVLQAASRNSGVRPGDELLAVSPKQPRRRRERCRPGLLLPDKRGHEAVCGSDTCASTNAGLHYRAVDEPARRQNRASLLARSERSGRCRTLRRSRPRCRFHEASAVTSGTDVGPESTALGRRAPGAGPYRAISLGR
jgi:hypothetical protein